MDVLIVEDDVNAAKAIRRILMNSGLQVELAENGQQALEILATDIPKLVTTDLMMPFMDGMEMLRRIRADERLRNIKVLMVSAVAQAKLKEALSAGADAVLSKPFSYAELTQTVVKLLSAAETAS